jgi:hypothetical protein
VLTVGSDIPYPPFEDFDPADGTKVIGFDADLITEIADRLDLTVEWIDTDFDTIFTQLATGVFDVVIAASTITPERALQVNFSEAYYNSQQAFIVNTALNPTIDSTDDLGAGDSVAVQTGTTGADWAAASLADQGVEVVSSPRWPTPTTPSSRSGDRGGVRRAVGGGRSRQPRKHRHRRVIDTRALRHRGRSRPHRPTRRHQPGLRRHARRQPTRRSTTPGSEAPAGSVTLRG